MTITCIRTTTRTLMITITRTPMITTTRTLMIAITRTPMVTITRTLTTRPMRLASIITITAKSSAAPISRAALP